MSSDVARMLATCAIWFSTATILTFGLFRMTGDLMFFMPVTAMICGAAVGGTALVWLSGKAKPPVP